MVASNMIHCVLFLMATPLYKLFLYQVQTVLVDYLKANHPHIKKKLIYFSGGCGGQYKNFMDLCSHKYECTSVEWVFFATSYCKL